MNLLDIFTYESITISDKGHNCTFLRDFGKFHKGDKVASISIQMNLLVWNEEGTLIEDDIIII